MSRISHLLIHVLDQQRKSTVPKGHGVFADGMASVASVSGRINPATGKEAAIGAQQKARVTHSIYLEPLSDVLVNDEFVYQGRRFRVVVPMIIPSIEIYVKALVEEIQNG